MIRPTLLYQDDHGTVMWSITSVISRMLLTHVILVPHYVVYQSVISGKLLTMSSWYNNVVYQSLIRPTLLYQDDHGTVMWSIRV